VGGELLIENNEDCENKWGVNQCCYHPIQGSSNSSSTSSSKAE